MSEHTVTVWGNACSVEVYQNSEGVWIASGDYKGKIITVKSRGATTALMSWRDAAINRDAK